MGQLNYYYINYTFNIGTEIQILVATVGLPDLDLMVNITLCSNLYLNKVSKGRRYAVRCS